MVPAAAQSHRFHKDHVFPVVIQRRALQEAAIQWVSREMAGRKARDYRKCTVLQAPAGKHASFELWAMVGSRLFQQSSRQHSRCIKHTISSPIYRAGVR